MHRSPEAHGPRSLAPREHVAYGQLFVPLVAALAMGRPTIGAIAIAVAGTAVFFAHEPALVLLGRRGARAHREYGPRARRRLFELGALTLVAGVAAAVSAPFFALAAGTALIPAAATVGWLAARGEEKTAAGELLAAAALAGVAMPVALAAGVPVSWSLGAWGAWTLAFGASTIAVRAVITHAKARIVTWRRMVAPLGAAGLAIVIGASGLAPWWCAAAAAPMIVVAIAVSASPPSPRALRRVGWMLVAASIAAAAILIVGARA
jgi:hypothetical protein